jgi:hypothetical protein
MRRVALIFMLLWLPLHWSWAAGLAVSGHAATAVDHAQHATVLEPVADTHAAGESAPADEQDEDCPLCQAADWQAALPSLPQFAPAEEPPPPFAEIAPFESFVPPVPEPPARLAAA